VTVTERQPIKGALPKEWPHLFSDLRVRPPNDRQPSSLSIINDKFPSAENNKSRNGFLDEIF
jgi:hypothetical protein